MSPLYFRTEKEHRDWKKRLDRIKLKKSPAKVKAVKKAKR